MNLRLIFLLAIVILPLAVYADQGRTFELDFKVKDQYNLLLKKSDRVLFGYGGFNHTIIADEIKANTTEIDIFLFLEKGLHTPDYQFLGKGYDIRLDFDRDGKKEMGIRLLKNNLVDGTTNILFEKLDAWDDNIKLSPDFTRENKTKTNKSNIKLTPYLIGGMVVAVLILIVLFFYYYSKRKGVYF